MLGLSSFFSKHGLALGLAIIGVLSVVTGWYRAKAETLEAQLTVAQGVITELDRSIAASTALADKHYKLLVAQREANTVIVRESRSKTIELNKYKSREQTVYRKPGLVEKLEQKALDKFMEDLDD